MSQSSYRTIIRGSSIMGGASLVNIVGGLVKMKVVAVLMGPAGIALLGIYQSLMQTTASVAGLGVTAAGTRRIASAAEDAGGGIALVRRALFWGTLAQAIVGGMVFWIVSGNIARGFMLHPERTGEVAWLALGAVLMVGAGAQTALLTGLRRIGDLARLQVGAAFAGVAGGLAALWIWGEGGLLALALIAPLSNFLLGHFYVSRLDGAIDKSPLVDVVRVWGAMAWLGVAVMISSVVTLAGHMAVRLLVQRDLGLDAVGQFQAAWTICTTYLAFILGAMGSDYFPRLVAVINDKVEATRLVNQQTEVALLLCGPVLVAMLGCAPMVIRLLYSSDFDGTLEILRWQLLGDILKVISWPLGFVLLALGSGKTVILTESVGIGIFVLGVAIGLPLIGVNATGVAFLALYIVYLPLVWWLSHRRIDFRWTRVVKLQALVLIGSALVVNFAANWSKLAGATAGLGIAFALSIIAFLRLSEVIGLGGRFGLILASVRRRLLGLP
jgi:O-antigen/teichoic acid export membrane protein